MVLKEIQMPPCLFLKIMGLTHTSTNWTWKFRPPVSLDPYFQLGSTSVSRTWPIILHSGLMPNPNEMTSDSFILILSYLFPVDLNLTSFKSTGNAEEPDKNKSRHEETLRQLLEIVLNKKISFYLVDAKKGHF